MRCCNESHKVHSGCDRFSVLRRLPVVVRNRPKVPAGLEQVCSARAKAAGHHNKTQPDRKAARNFRHGLKTSPFRRLALRSPWRRRGLESQRTKRHEARTSCLFFRRQTAFADRRVEAGRVIRSLLTCRSIKHRIILFTYQKSAVIVPVSVKNLHALVRQNSPLHLISHHFPLIFPSPNLPGPLYISVRMSFLIVHVLPTQQ